MHFRLIFITIITIVFITACTQEKQSNSNEIADYDGIRVEQTENNNGTNLDNNELADHLANIAADVPNVNDAVAIVVGPYTVVGIDIQEDTERQKVGTIKYSVSESLANDAYGRDAVVIADADVMQRLRNMKDKVNNGESIEGILEELASIISRYIPIFPAEDDSKKNQAPPIEELDENENIDV